MSEFTRVKNLSDRRRMPRRGKIRLGTTLKAQSGKDYPVELPFFLLPDSLVPIFGGQFNNALFSEEERQRFGGDHMKIALNRAAQLGCTRKDVLGFIEENYHRMTDTLPIMFPVDEEEKIFPQAYKWYGKNKGLKCIGDGEKARRLKDKDGNKIHGGAEMECPCDNLKSDQNTKGECTLSACLMVVIEKDTLTSVYQIDTGSYNSIMDLNSGLEVIRGLMTTNANPSGRITMVPLVLERVKTNTYGSGSKETHFTLQINLDGGLERLAYIRENTDRLLAHGEGMRLALPEPDYEEPVEVEFADAEDEEPPTGAPQEPQDEIKEAEGMEAPETATEPPEEGAETTYLALMARLIAFDKSGSQKSADVAEIWADINEARKQEQIDTMEYELLRNRKDDIKKKLAEEKPEPEGYQGPDQTAIPGTDDFSDVEPL
jgi:hypothetical protein